MLGESQEEVVADVLRAECDLVRVFERQLLGLVVALARFVVMDVVEFLVADAIVSADGRIEIRSERTTVQPRNPDTDKRFLSERETAHLAEGCH